MNELFQVDSRQPARTIGQVTEEINYLTAQAQRLILGHAIEIGRRLTEAKEMLPHGEWSKWLQEEVHYSASSANNMMRIFEAYGDSQMSLFGPAANSQTFGNLDYSKALALLAMPEDEREAFAQQVDAEHISVRKLREEIAARKAQQETAESSLRETAAALEQAQTDLDSRQKTIDDLEQQLQQAQNRPQETIVQTIDASEAQITAAEEKGKQEGRRAAESAMSERVSQAEAQAAQAEQEAKAAKQALKDAKKAAEGAMSERVSQAEAKAAQAEKAAQEAREALENAKKRLAGQASERALVELNVQLRQLQETKNRIVQQLTQLDEVTRQRIRAALERLLQQMLEQIKEENTSCGES